MKVLLTGGTGFVGGHAAAAIAADGHDLRLLVRRPHQVETTLAPFGLEVPDLVVGDATDPDAVTNAIDGCDAVVHAAAIYSLDPRRAAAVQRTNQQAAEVVLGRSVEAGLDPVVHVSSTVALTRYAGSDPTLPLGDIDLPYTQSKIASERIARRLQDEGHPVVIVYPGSVYGPHDPYRGDQGERLRWVLQRRLVLWPSGGLHVVDARDVAAVLAAVLEPGKDPRRYVVPGHHVDAETLFGTMAEVTGRRYPHVVLPAAVVGPMTRLFDLVQQRLPRRWHAPVEREGTEIVLRDTWFDGTAARRELGVEPRPLTDTVRDTVRWLVDSGRSPARFAPSP